MAQADMSYEDLRKRLEEAEDLIAALRGQQVDAVVGGAGVSLVRLRETEEALRRSERLLRRLIDGNIIGVVVAESDRITNANDAFLEIVGCSQEDLLAGRIDWRAMTPPEYEPADASALEQLLSTGTVTPFEKEYVRPDGGRVPVLVGATLITREPLTWVAFAVDLTAQKRTERALRVSNRRLELAIAATEGGVYEHAVPIDETTYLDGRFLEIIGYTEEELPPAAEFLQWFYGRTHTDDRPRVMKEYAALVEGRSRRRVAQVRFRHKSGHWIWILDFARALERDETGRARRLTGVMLDISRQKRTELALKRLNESLERRVAERTADAERRATQLRRLAVQLSSAEDRERERIAGLLHDDLQQQLAGLKYVLATHFSPGETVAQDAVEALGGQIDECVEKTREFSHELSPLTLALGGFTAALEWLAEDMERKHGLRVTIGAAPGSNEAPPEVASVLFRAVRELLFNVHKHAGVDTASVEVKGAGGRLEVCVADDGSGFDMSLQRSTRNSAGLGLFSLEERVRSLGGELDLRSAPGKGTRVTIAMPLTEVALARPGRQEEATSTGRPCSVLLASDHEVMTRGLASLLRQRDELLVVGQATTGEEVVRSAEELRPDVVLMDVSSTEIEGAKVTARIKHSVPETEVIALSMSDDARARARFLKAGATAFLGRTESPDTLLDLLLSTANRRNPYRTPRPPSIRLRPPAG